METIVDLQFAKDLSQKWWTLETQNFQWSFVENNGIDVSTKWEDRFA